jgi:transposase
MTAQAVKTQKPLNKILKRGRPKKTKDQTVKAMVIAGMTEREIAKAMNSPKTTVHDMIHRNFTQEELETFKTQEANALRAFRLKYLELIDQTDIKKMISTRGFTDYGIAYDKERLERGQTTGNIGVGVALSEPLQAAVDLIARRAASKNGRIEIEEVPQSGGEDASRPDE